MPARREMLAQVPPCREQAARRRSRGYAIGWHLAALLLVIGVVEMPRFARHSALPAALFSPASGYLDFDQAYYPAAEQIRSDPGQVYRGATYDGRTGVLDISAPAYFVNVPLVAWLFVPLTFLPLPQAGAVFLAINAALALASLFLLQRRAAGAGEGWRWAITAVFITSGPLLNGLNLGQTTLLILLLLLAAEGSLRRGHDVRAGCWLGLACLVKMPPLVFLPYFALRRRWRVLVAATAVLLAAAGVSIASYGWRLHVTYFDLAIRANARTALAAHNSQSVDSLLARITTDASIRSWQPEPLGQWAVAIKWVILAGLMGVAGWILGSARAPETHARVLRELGALMCLALLAFPVVWVHYGAWLLPVIVVIGAAAAELKPVPAMTLTAVLALAAVLINFPTPALSTIKRLDHEPWFRLAISHQLFGTLLLYVLCLWCVRRDAAGLDNAGKWA